jgi:hypothetical protein
MQMELLSRTASARAAARSWAMTALALALWRRLAATGWGGRAGVGGLRCEHPR